MLQRMILITINEDDERETTEFYAEVLSKPREKQVQSRGKHLGAVPNSKQWVLRCQGTVPGTITPGDYTSVELWGDEEVIFRPAQGAIGVHPRDLALTITMA